MSSLIEKLFKAQQARFGKDEKTLINSLAKKQDPWPNGIVKNALSITIKIVNGFKCFVVQDKHHEPNDNRIVFIHGGAYVGEISQIHWFYIRNLIKKTNAKIYVPIYPLTTNEYSGQLDSIDFLVNLYKQITENEPNKIYHIFGDSAGGNLGLILAQQIKMNNYKHPQNLILFSPVLSMEDTVTAEVLAKNDPILPYDMLKTLIN
jgi:acetyl esterase/lipase